MNKNEAFKLKLNMYLCGVALVRKDPADDVEAYSVGRKADSLDGLHEGFGAVEFEEV